MPRYVLEEPTGGCSEPFEAASDEEALEEARERVGEWVDPDAEGHTVWVREDLLCLDDSRYGRLVTTLLRALHPARRCAEGEHRWIAGRRLAHLLVGGDPGNPGVWASGGGVRVTEVCARCGITLTRDTWCCCAQRGGEPHECRFVEPVEVAERRLEEAWGAEVAQWVFGEVERGPAEWLERLWAEAALGPEAVEGRSWRPSP